MAFEPPKPSSHPVIYADMSKNLSEVKFDVYVKESYVPVVHYSYLGEGAPPPVRAVDDVNCNDVCVSKLPITFIVDALVNGEWISFKNIADIKVVIDWIDRYLASFESMDLTAHPDVIGFNNNAKRARDILAENQRHYEDYQETRRPRKISIQDILAGL